MEYRTHTYSNVSVYVSKGVEYSYLCQTQPKTLKIPTKSLQLRSFQRASKFHQRFTILFASLDLENQTRITHISHSPKQLRPQKNHLTPSPPISARRELRKKLHNSGTRPNCQYHTCGVRVRTSSRSLSNFRGRRSRAGARGARGGG